MSSLASRKVSYLLICSSYPPVLGGSEVEAQRVSEALIARGYRALVVTVGGPPMPPGGDYVDPHGVPVRQFGESVPVRFRQHAYALGVAWTLWRERHNYEVAYFLMQGLQLLFGLPVARMLGKPIVMKFSCSSLVDVMTASWTGRTVLGFLRKWANRILVLNEGMREECRAAQLPLDRVSWMPNPVNTDEFRPLPTEDKQALRRRLNIPDDSLVTLFVGRLDHQKKLPWTLGAFARVVRERPNALLVLVGDGPLREEVHALARSLGIWDNVRFTGRLPMAGVLEWMQASDLTILISEIEGLPCSLIEAMAAGLPPVVSRIPAHTQLVDHEVHGLLTDLGSEESAAAAVIRLMDDHDLRARTATAARQRMIRQFSTPEVVRYYETLFDEVLKEPLPR